MVPVLTSRKASELPVNEVACILQVRMHSRVPTDLEALAHELKGVSVRLMVTTDRLLTVNTAD